MEYEKSESERRSKGNAEQIPRAPSLKTPLKSSDGVVRRANSYRGSFLSGEKHRREGRKYHVRSKTIPIALATARALLARAMTLQAVARGKKVVSDPFRVTGPTCISFSGGRTSAYMLWRVLQSNGGLPADAVVWFANTGLEAEETLAFVDKCASAWNVPIQWLE